MDGFIFDSCTEMLLQEIIDSPSNTNLDAEKLKVQLADFQKQCLDLGLCPKGEFIRGQMCRDFLRDAVLRMRKRLALLHEDPAISNIVETTELFIETLGGETEAERAYIVVRNLIIVAGNIQKQMKKQMLPIISKQPVQLTCYHIDPEGIREFEEIAGFKRDKDIDRLLKLKLSPITAKQDCEARYRNLFFNVLIRLITMKETGEGGNIK